MACGKCFHEKENHDSSICNGSLTCLCPEYEQPTSEFINEINKALASMITTKTRVKYILTKIPNLRNAGEKSFSKAYRNLVYGLKQNDPIPRGLWKNIPHDDTINRAKRNIQQFYPYLAKTDHKAIVMAGATQEGILEALYDT